MHLLLHLLTSGSGTNCECRPGSLMMHGMDTGPARGQTFELLLTIDVVLWCWHHTEGIVS